MNEQIVHAATPELDRDDANQKPGLLTKEEIAGHYSIGLRTVNAWMKKRILPYLKIGRVVRFNLADCDAALSKFKVGGRI